MSNKNKALTALKRKKFNTGSVAVGPGFDQERRYDDYTTPLEDIKVTDPAKNSLAIQPKPFEVTAATAQKIDTGFDSGAMTKAFKEKGNIRSATYNKETGLYDYVDVKGRYVRGKTPEEMLRFTNETTLNPFSTMQTQSGDVSKLATGTPAVDTKASIGPSATSGTSTTSKATTAIMGDEVVDHAAIIQDAMDRQPLFGNPPKKMMDYSYDKKSGEYVIDNAGWGFEGDARFTRLSPEEFYDKMGINSNKFTMPSKAAKASTYTAGEVEESDFVTATGAKNIDPETGLPAKIKEAEAGAATLTDAAKAAERDSFEETLAKGTAAQRPTEEPRVLSDKQAKVEYSQSEAGRAVYTAKAQAEQQYANKERSIREKIRRAATPEERNKLNDELVANYRNRSKMLSDFSLAVKEGAALTKQNAASGIKQYAEGVTTAQTQQVADVAGPAVTTSDGVTISADAINNLKLNLVDRGVGADELETFQNLISSDERTAQQGTAAKSTEVLPLLGEEARDISIEQAEQEYFDSPEGKAWRENFKQGSFLIAGKLNDVDKELEGVTTPERRQQLEEQKQSLTNQLLDRVTVATAEIKEKALETQANAASMAPTAKASQANFISTAYTPDGGTTEIEDTPAYDKASSREAQIGTAAERTAAELGTAPSVDFKGREAITGTAPQGDASQIGGVPTMAAASRNAVQGKERKVAAADMMAVVAGVPEEVTAAISEDPATVEAQIDSGADPQVTAAVAALPQEALVSVQMENLLAGMEDGETPAWARPAVAQVEQMMAQRGLSASTVGRDALFNAIIQSALPMAQSNAQALQQRAQQNLSNQQQANLGSAQNTMTVRMQNLANRQTAASQTASMAQEIRVQQGSFKQQATITTAQQEQQTEMATFQAAQQKSQQESAQRQQAAIAELNTNAQMDLANLQAMNAADSESMSAEQQARLTGYNAQIAKVMRQADLKQDMEKANLNSSLQLRLANLSEMNAAAKDTMTAENQEELTNLQTLVEFRKGDAQFAQQMDMANMSNEQQMELAMLQDKAATDAANFTADNQFELTRLNNVVARSVRQAELNQRMEEVNLDAKLKLELSELTEANATARANMSADQQTRLANLNVLVDFKKTNAAMAQQMDLANLGNEQQMELANLAERAATDSANMTAENKLRSQKLNNYVQVMSQDEQLKQQADLANLSMEEKISLANLSNQQQSDMASMSAENVAELQRYEKQMGAAQLNANLAQQMGLANLSNQQQASMFNAQIDANLDMKQFDANQQMALANSQFMQSMTMKNLDNKQQAAMQNATAMASMDLQAADNLTKVSIENARNFLAMDMAELNNDQQAAMLNAQQAQQTLLSNFAASNASKQFNATSEQQTNQFMANLGQTMNQFNASQANAMTQFNASEKNRLAAIDAGNALEADKMNTQINAQVDQYNADNELKREQWNAANEQAVEQGNVAWRRQANTIDTAAQNASNQLAVQQAFSLNATEQNMLWQQLSDEQNYLRQGYENEQQRRTTLYATALANESATGPAGTVNTIVTAIITAMGGT